MANLTITSSSVLSSSTAFARSIAAAAIAAGEVIYKLANGTVGLADANGASPANTVEGIALNSAAAGQPVDYVREDPTLTVGSVLTVGAAYFLSATAGKMCPAADLASGDKAIFLGVAVSASVLNFKPVVGGTVPA